MNKPFLTALLILLFCGFGTQSFAQMSEAEIRAEIADNISGEYIDCGAYFTIVTEGVRKAGDLVTAEGYDKQVEKCYSIGYVFIKSSRDEDMARKVAVSRVKMTIDAMRAEIGNNYSNLSLLSVKHLNKCVAIMEDPTEMMEHWSQEIRSKY
jgi:hypothetical protein